MKFDADGLKNSIFDIVHKQPIIEQLSQIELDKFLNDCKEHQEKQGTIQPNVIKVIK